MNMKLEIISPESILFQGEVDNVSLPGTAGLFDILPHHTPLIAALKAGTIRYTTNEKKQALKIQNGFVEVKDETISVCIE